MLRTATFIALFCAGPTFAQTLVSDPNGTVTGSFLGTDIALDVLCERNPFLTVTTHSPLSQSLIGGVSEDALVISMFNNSASFIANIAGETFMTVDTDFGTPDFPASATGDDFDIVISCPADF